jgi:phosphatidylserine/phosphatidylglycerophosphate/cardiolipin synthase-like enzyme
VHPAAYVVVACCACLVAGVVPGATPQAEPEIVEIYPNPAAPQDSGEFITVKVPAGTDISAYQLADEQANVSLSQPSTISSGTSFVTFSTDTKRTSSLTNQTVASIPDRIQLANGGERVQLLRDGKVVDEVEYEQAPEAELYDVEASAWSPLGRTKRPVVTHTGGTVEAFVLPDESKRAVAFLENATERILLSAYTVSSDAVVRALIDARERGVAVEVLAEGSPVGGMSASSATALDELSRGGVTVRVFTDEMARFRFHHAKYAVVDSRALVTTENWKASGIGGGSSRGWGVITAQDRVVEGLVETFRGDSDWVDTTPWAEYEEVTPVEDDDTTEGSYPKNFEAETLSVDTTRLLLAPDNAEKAVRETIGGAEERIDIKQMQIGSRGFPLLRAVLDAAERGVEVRILLSGAWYVEEENRQLKRWLDEQAEAGGLPLSVRIAKPDGRFEKIHAKGLIVDGEHTFVGSLNWNNNSLRNNREVGLLLESQAVGAYFETVFESDWSRTDETEIPLGYIAACLIGALIAVVAGHRIEFED